MAKQKDIKHEEDLKNKDLYEGLVKEMNEKIVCH